MIEVAIAGSGCRNCLELARRVQAVLTAMECEATILKLTDFKDIVAAGVLTTPGLIVNGTVVSQGRVPDEDAIRGWLQQAVPTA